jgi:hypothetical protein
MRDILFSLCFLCFGTLVLLFKDRLAEWTVQTNRWLWNVQYNKVVFRVVAIISGVFLVGVGLATLMLIIVKKMSQG